MTTMNDNIIVIHHLVARLLLAMWHLHCVWVREWGWVKDCAGSPMVGCCCHWCMVGSLLSWGSFRWHHCLHHHHPGLPLHCCCSSFGCHVAISDVAPGFWVNREMERGACVGLTWRKTPMDGDDIMHCRHRPASSLSLLHCVNVVDTSFLAMVGDMAFCLHD